MGAMATSELLGPLNPTEQKFAPSQLWVDGDRRLLAHHPRVAIVGTRHPTAVGVRRAERLVRELVTGRVTIVSGLAEGIDTIAHTRCIASGGRTIAVIGTPLEQVYPRTNARLQATIGKDHLVVSEFAPGTPVARGNFVRRNRTMALIADASIIVEAGESSGTLSQGWETLRLGRPLFLLKSLVDGPLEWPRKMIEHGALVLRDTSDVLGLLPTGELREAIAF